MFNVCDIKHLNKKKDAVKSNSKNIWEFDFEFHHWNCQLYFTSYFEEIRNS